MVLYSSAHGIGAGQSPPCLFSQRGQVAQSTEVVRAHGKHRADVQASKAVVRHRGTQMEHERPVAAAKTVGEGVRLPRWGRELPGMDWTPRRDTKQASAGRTVLESGRTMPLSVKRTPKGMAILRHGDEISKYRQV